MCNTSEPHSHVTETGTTEVLEKLPAGGIPAAPEITVQYSNFPAEDTILNLNESSIIKAHSLLRYLNETVAESSRIRRELLLARKRLASRAKCLGKVRRAYEDRRAEIAALRAALRVAEEKLRVVPVDLSQTISSTVGPNA